MIEAVKELWEFDKCWLGKHWKGYLVYFLVCIVGIVALLNRSSIITWFKKKFKKEKES